MLQAVNFTGYRLIWRTLKVFIKICAFSILNRIVYLISGGFEIRPVRLMIIILLRLLFQEEIQGAFLFLILRDLEGACLSIQMSN